MLKQRIFIAWCFGICGLLVGGALAIAQSSQSKLSQVSDVPKRVDDTPLYMRAKLASSQKVMEGLVTENFDLIREGATQMKRISEAAHWPKTVDEIYQHYSVAFRRQCDKLNQQADRKDLQAAHYTYLHMSTTCIDCHNYVRGRFKVEQKRPNGPVRLIPTEWDGPVKRKLPPPQPDDDKGARAANIIR